MKFIFKVLYYVVVYVWTVVVLKNIFENVKYKNSGIAYIPILNSFALADIVHDDNGKVYITKNFGVSKDLFCLGYMLSDLLCYVPAISIIGYLMSIIFSFKIYGYVYSCFDKKSESDEALAAALSAIIPFVFLLKASTYLGKKPGPEEREKI